MSFLNGGELLGRLDPQFQHVCRRLGNLAGEAGVPIYIVGGIVRDLLLGYGSMDFDFVLEGDAISFATLVEARFGGTIKTHPRFRTANWRPADLPSLDIDLVTARSETYAHPAALPVVTPADLKADLLRRDFTINTMAIRLDPPHWGTFLDPYSGHDDLQNDLLRVLYPQSFRDDPTRIWRGVRFEQRFCLNFEPQTAAWLRQATPQLARLSGERIAHELLLVVQEGEPSLTMSRLNELGVLSSIHPQLRWTAGIAGWWETVEQQVGTRFLQAAAFEWEWRLPQWRLLLFLMGQSADVGVEVARRLRLPLREQTALKAALHLRKALSVDPFAGQEPPVSVIDHWLRPLAEPPPAIALVAITLMNGPADRRVDWLKNYLLQWRKVRPAATGRTLRDRGVPPGPSYRKILGRLRAGWLDGHITSAAQERVYLDEILAEGDS